MQRRFRFLSPGITLLMLSVLVLTGCEPQAQITSYTVPKPESVETPPNKPFRPAPPAPAPTADIQFELPEGWKEIPAKQFTIKAFEVVDGDDRLEITISRAGGAMDDNMNRWRGQIGLPRVPAAEIEAAFQPREVNGQPGQFIELHQAEDAENRQSIVGIVIPEGDQTWFFKVRGPTKLAERERKNFETFAQSVRW